jgi:ATP-binding cassette subfamily C protein
MLPRLLREVLRLFTGRERATALFLLALSFLGALLEMAGVALVMPFVALLGDPGRMNSLPILRPVVSALGAADPATFILRFGILLTGFFLLKNLLLGMLIHAQSRFVYGKMQRTAGRLFSAYLRAPFSFHFGRNSAELQRNINTDVPQAFHWVVAHSFILAGDAFVIAVVSGLLFFVDPWASLASLGLLAIAGFLWLRAGHRRASALGVTEQAGFGRMIRWVNQGLGGAKEVKVLGVASFFLDRWGDSAREFAEARRRAATRNETPRLIFETIAVAALLVIVALTLARGEASRQALPVAALFAAAAFRLMPAMSRLLRCTGFIRHYRPSFDVVRRDLAALESIGEEQDDSSGAAISLRESVVMRDVWFAYPGQDTPVLAGVDAVIPRGSVVAFVGASGAGKTTVADLLLGLFPPARGAVLVDGADIAEDLSAWRRSCGTIPQSIYLLDDTVRRNVAFGVRDGEIDDAAVFAALAGAKLDDFVRSQPGGLDTAIGEDGARLSGGQRQRLGIARALYRGPAFLVLDEATSALDPETEREVTKTVLGLKGERTVVVIAHRLSTVKDCDRLFFLSAGRVAAAGTFEELAASCPEFRRMAQLDASGGST